MSPPSDVGPLVRLWGLRTAQLPPSTASPEELTPFLTSLLKEAVPFIDSAAPKDSNNSNSKLWKPKGTKTHKDSTAPIVVSERTIPTAELEQVKASNPDCNAQQLGGGGVGAELWACRRSLHEDTDSKAGTASWAEFVQSFIEEHAETEAAFTPEVLAHHEAIAWDSKTRGLAIEVGDGTKWTDFRLKVTEMRHKMPPPLRHRTFPVLQMSCSSAAKGGDDYDDDEKEFIFLSVPVRDFGTAGSENSKLSKEKGTQVAYYVSIERVRKIRGGGGDEDGKIEWLMATASDAAGVIPAWVNNIAMPGVVWKDVPLFLGWIAKERNGKGKESKPREEDGAAGGEGAATVTTGTEVQKVSEVSAEAKPEVTTGPEVGQAPEKSTGEEAVT